MKDGGSGRERRPRGGSGSERCGKLGQLAAGEHLAVADEPFAGAFCRELLRVLLAREVWALGVRRGRVYAVAWTGELVVCGVEGDEAGPAELGGLTKTRVLTGFV